MKFMTKLSASTAALLTSFSLHATPTDLNDNTAPAATAPATTTVVPLPVTPPLDPNAVIPAVPVVDPAVPAIPTSPSITPVPAASVPGVPAEVIPAPVVDPALPATPASPAPAAVDPTIPAAVTPAALVPAVPVVDPAVPAIPTSPSITPVPAASVPAVPAEVIPAPVVDPALPATPASPAPAAVDPTIPAAMPAAVTPAVPATPASPSVTPVTPTVLVPVAPASPVKNFDPADYNHNGIVTGAEELEFIKQTLENVFHSFKVSVHNLKNLNMDEFKHFLGVDNNGKINFNGVMVALKDIEVQSKSFFKAVIDHAKHFRKFIIGYKEQLTNNPLFVALPQNVQDIFNKILNTSESAANTIANGATVAEGVSTDLEGEMNSLSQFIKDGTISPEYLQKNAVYLSNFVNLIDKWEASGNTSAAATTILSYLNQHKVAVKTH